MMNLKDTDKARMVIDRLQRCGVIISAAKTYDMGEKDRATLDEIDKQRTTYIELIEAVKEDVPAALNRFESVLRKIEEFCITVEQSLRPAALAD